MRVGDADAALAGAAVVVRERFNYPRQTAAALETRGLVAVPPDPRGGELHLIGSTKCIHINRTILAPIFGIPPGALRLTEVDVGGGFGVRGELYPEDILVPLAAMKLGRPVKWIESRRENLMAANHAREVDVRGRDRLRRATAASSACARVIRADIGAYVRTAALVPAEFGAALLPGPYRVPSYACDLWSVVTNKTPAGTLRSPGRPECNFVRERLMDQGAARLGLDPAEIRRRNLIRADEMPYDCGTKSFGVSTVYDSGDFPALFDELLRRLDYDRARAEQAALNARPGARRGIGLAVYVEKTGLGPFETDAGRGARRRHASSSTPARPRWARGSRPCSPRSSARRSACRPPASTSATPTPPPSRAASAPTARAAPSPRATRRRWPRPSSSPRRAPRAAARLGVPEADVRYAAGALEAGGRRVTLAELAAERPAGRRRLVRGAEDHLRGLRVRRRARRRPRDGRARAAARGGRRRRGPRGEPGAGRRASSWAASPSASATRCTSALVYDGDGQLRLRHAHGLRAALRAPTCRRSTASTRRCAPRPTRSACAGSASAATPASARAIANAVCDALRDPASASRRCR